MVVIRLARAGAKNTPFYHLTVADSRRARDSRFIERVGFFNPVARGQQKRIEVDRARVEYWIGQGARLSERASRLLREASMSAEDREKLMTWRQQRHVRRRAAGKEQAAADTGEAPQVQAEEAAPEAAAEEQAAADTGEAPQVQAEEAAPEAVAEEQAAADTGEAPQVQAEEAAPEAVAEEQAAAGTGEAPQAQAEEAAPEAEAEEQAAAGTGEAPQAQTQEAGKAAKETPSASDASGEQNQGEDKAGSSA